MTVLAFAQGILARLNMKINMSKDELRIKLTQMFMDAKYDRENPSKLAEQLIAMLYEDEDRKVKSLARLIMYIQKMKGQN